MGGFAIYPAPGRGSDDARSTQHSTPTASTRTSSISSLDSDDPHPPGHTLETPPSSRRHHHHRSSSSARLFQKLRTVLPVLTTLTPRCGRMTHAVAGSSSSEVIPAARRPCGRVTGTLYGRRKGRVALALQETPRCVPGLVVELALQTHTLLRELGNPAGARIVLEAERRDQSAGDGEDDGKAAGGGGRRRSHRHRRHGGPPLLDEPRWTMFCNGRKTGYAVRREATGDDLSVLETLRAVSMGAGVLPAGRSPTTSSASDAQAVDDEVPYMRGSFDHFVGSRDSESLYMIAPQGGGTGPELAVFFVRL